MKDFRERGDREDTQTNRMCYACINAAGGGDCEWANDLEPVEGWTATYNKKTGSYHITACPKFEKGDRLWSAAKKANACKY